MITVHASESRGHAAHGWLDTYHTFSFNTYHNREMMRFRSLRVMNSEFNPSKTDPVHLYQIWLLPERKGIEPSYQQKRFDDAQLQDRLHLVASPDAKDGSLAIHQDAKIYLAKLGIGVVIRHDLNRERHAWLQLMRGTLAVGKHEMTAGDGTAISDEAELLVRASSDAEVLLFDLA